MLAFQIAGIICHNDFCWFVHVYYRVFRKIAYIRQNKFYNILKMVALYDALIRNIPTKRNEMTWFLRNISFFFCHNSGIRKHLHLHPAQDSSDLWFARTSRMNLKHTHTIMRRICCDSPEFMWRLSLKISIHTCISLYWLIHFQNLCTDALPANKLRALCLCSVFLSSLQLSTGIQNMLNANKL